MDAGGQDAIAAIEHLGNDLLQIFPDHAVFLAEAAQRIQILQPRHRFVPLDAVERLLLGEHMNVPHQAELRQYIDQGGARAAKFQFADTHPSPGFWRRLRGRQDNDLLLVRLIGRACAIDRWVKPADLLAQQTIVAVGTRSGGQRRIHASP